MHYPLINKFKDRFPYFSIMTNYTQIQFEFELYILRHKSMETPKKTKNPYLSDNEPSRAPLTFGEKFKKIGVDQHAVHREVIGNSINYAHSRNIVPSVCKGQDSSIDDSNRCQIQKREQKNYKKMAASKIMIKRQTKRIKQAQPDQIEELRRSQYQAKQEQTIIISPQIALQQQRRRQLESYNTTIQQMIGSIGRQQSQLYQQERMIEAITKQSLQATKDILQVLATIKVQVQTLLKKQKQAKQIQNRISVLDKNYKTLMERNQIKRKERKQIHLCIAVLKMQINPFLRVKFSPLQLTNRYTWRREGILWQKNQKLLSQDEVKFFIIIQLYPSWRRILNRLSHNFEGYNQILFADTKQSTDKILQVTDYIQSIMYNGRPTISNNKCIIALYTPLDIKQEQLISTIKSLAGQNNGIIDILKVNFEPTQEYKIQDITIEYSYKNEKLVKKIEFIRIQQLTHKVVSELLPTNGNKATLLSIYVPAIMPSAEEKYRYEEVFDLIRKEK